MKNIFENVETFAIQMYTDILMSHVDKFLYLTSAKQERLSEKTIVKTNFAKSDLSKITSAFDRSY